MQAEQLTAPNSLYRAPKVNYIYRGLFVVGTHYYITNQSASCSRYVGTNSN